MNRPEDLHPMPPDLPPSLQKWWEGLHDQIKQAYEPGKNGHIPKWMEALSQLPSPGDQTQMDLSRAAIWDGTSEEMDVDIWRSFHPWRKGPYQLGQMYLDTEWRSDWKWDRLLPHVQPLAGRTCLDVGCGNGYHLWRMIAEGARHAIGVDPFLLYVFQFHAIHRRFPLPNVQVLPVGVEALTSGMEVDTVFSMGVLYHAKDPLDHLRTLRKATKPSGELVLETMIAPEERHPYLEINGRYARMRNIPGLPTERTLLEWVKTSGWISPRIVDVTVTTTEEQRSTEWMTFHSLKNYLDPEDSSKTVEGYPAPTRCVLIAQAPA